MHRYNEQGQLVKDFSLPTFKDTAWRSGTAQLGYDRSNQTKLTHSPIFPRTLSLAISWCSAYPQRASCSLCLVLLWAPGTGTGTRGLSL
jgi:hypothetical protein